MSDVAGRRAGRVRARLVALASTALLVGGCAVNGNAPVASDGVAVDSTEPVVAPPDGDSVPASDDDVLPPSDAAVALVTRRLESLLEQPLTLEIATRRERDGWLYLDGLPRDTAGARIDYASTSYADDIAEGWFDDGFVALLRRADAGKGWVVLELELGATDAPFVDWENRHGAPPGLVVPR